jgi:hypothetical protein
VGVGLGIAILAWIVVPKFRPQRSLTGAVLIANADPRKQLPIPNAEIIAETGQTTARTKSDSSGFFRLNWRGGGWPNERVTLKVHHPEYQPLEIVQSLSDNLNIIRMTPSASLREMERSGPEVVVANIRVRYAVKATTTVNIGSTARTFEVVNSGNVPCEGHQPCSPDGKWKATIGSISLDAGDGQEFQNVRISCIAGPCPFSKIETDGFSRGGRTISASVRAWSDSVTLLVEAEVVHTMLTDAIRQAYPSKFGRDMTFTLPAAGQGPSIEAEIGGQEIVFPLGPDLRVSWATCSLQVAPNRTKLYSCELKPGYRFQ